MQGNLEEVMKLSWTDELYQVYENNCGKDDEKNILLPVSHSTANAQIEVMLSETGEFVSASRIESKDSSVTIIPVTEDSGSRSAGIAPHPLADKLVYIAGDYPEYATGKRADNQAYYQAYMKQLEGWRESESGHPAVGAVCTYLKKKTLMRDLLGNGTLLLDENTGKLKEKEKILGIAQEDAFVRFRINYEDMLGTESRTWKDKTLYDSFVRYNGESAGSGQLCYATGRVLPYTYKHPSKIRNAGDKAKLISSNDESGFTYRGRFASKEEALSVSYDFSQKMHNALKWLIEKQGISIGTMTVVAWESNLQPLPDIIRNPEDAAENNRDLMEEETESEELLDDFEEDFDGFEENTDRVTAPAHGLVSDTMAAYRSRLQKAVWGSSNERDIASKLEERSKAMIMGLDAATTGRLAMTMYTEMAASDFRQNVEKWHFNTAWNRFIPKKKKREIHSFSLYEITECAFGTEQGNFIKCKPEVESGTILRLIPCVTEGRNIPSDIVRSLVNKASRPLSYKQKYNWYKVLETACGMIRKTIIEEKERSKQKGEYEVALDYQCADRDYLYGRLLAIAQAAEAATYVEGEGRITNAERYFESFTNRPCRTWEYIYKRLKPYLNRMKTGQRKHYEEMMEKVTDQFKPGEFMDNSKLKPEYLLAYHCQLNEIYTKKSKSEEDE